MPRSNRNNGTISRRAVLASMGAAGAALSLDSARALAQAVPQAGDIQTRAIPATGETIPAIGMGTWITFNVGEDEELRKQRAEVLGAFFERGGGMIDSSPMYGSSEEVLGYCLGHLGHPESLFAATKVWTMTQWNGKRQMANSEELWASDEGFDLMQVHNLLDWDSHLETLKAWKAEGRIRYIGVTTSHGSRHAETEKLMREQPVDFVQFTYNILDREAADRLLPLAADRGIAVICNRPFRRKQLIRRFETHPLPDWAEEIDCANWAQFLLKFIISHPAVTCAIPATTRVDHMRENMDALHGALPDAETRRRMVRYVESL